MTVDEYRDRALEALVYTAKSAKLCLAASGSHGHIYTSAVKALDTYARYRAATEQQNQIEDK